MAMSEWWRPLTPEEETELENLVALDCPNVNAGDCKESTYPDTMCDNCKKYYERSAEIFGIPPKQLITDVKQEQDRMAKVFIEAFRGGTKTIQ